MELNYVNVRHPDFVGTHMERVRADATTRVRQVGVSTRVGGRS